VRLRVANVDDQEHGGALWFTAVQAKLYVVASSHPCWAVSRALELKGIRFSRVEWPPPLHAPVQRLRFGQRTVPGLVIDGERIVGSRRIMHRLDELVPEPRLYPSDRVEEADRWGDEVLQPLARRMTWWALRHRPDAIVSFSADSRLPVPKFVIKRLTPLIAPIEWRLNEVGEDTAERDLRALPEHLAQVDEWIAEGVLAWEQPNAADLQIGSSLALLRTMEDLRPLVDGRPCGQLASRHFGAFPGFIPAGVLPAV
jgi:glutathione S-transferase